MAAGAAHAQNFEVSILGSLPGFSGTGLGMLPTSTATGGKDTDVTLHSKYGYGARLTANTRGYYGHELGYTFNKARLRAISRPDENTANVLEDNVNIQEAFYNFLIYFMPSRERVRPFITGGLQAYRYGAPKSIADFPGGIYKNYGVNWGGGLKVNLFSHALVRWDFRDYVGGKPYNLTFEDPSKSGGVLHQWELSMGLAITF